MNVMKNKVLHFNKVDKVVNAGTNGCAVNRNVRYSTEIKTGVCTGNRLNNAKG